MKNYIVGLGEILFDCLPDGKKLGGAPANFAYHVTQFGLNGLAVSAIGNDEDGKEVVRQLAANAKRNSQCKELKETPNSVSLEGAFHLEKVPEATGTVQVTLSGNGIPQYDICLGVAYDNIPWTPEIEEIAKNTRAVCFGSLAQRTAVSRETIHKFLDTMPQLGTLKVFDINLRQSWYSKEVIEESLNRCNVLKINDEEIVKVAEMFGSPLTLAEGDPSERLLQPVEFEDFCGKIIETYGLDMIVLTCGAFGSYVVYNKPAQGGEGTGIELSFQSTPKVKVADTVGAGDSFTGSFCAAILAGKPVREAHKIGVDVSAFVCTQKGAMPAYPQELIDKIK